MSSWKNVNKRYLTISVFLTVLFSCQPKGPTLMELKEQGKELQQKISESRKIESEQVVISLNLKSKFKQNRGRGIASKPGVIEYIPSDDSNQHFDDLIQNRKESLK